MLAKATNGNRPWRRRKPQYSRRSFAGSVLAPIFWRIGHAFALFAICVFLIGVGFAVGLVLLERIRTGGL